MVLILSLFFSIFLSFSVCIFYMCQSFLNSIRNTCHCTLSGNNLCFLPPINLPYNALTKFQKYLNIQQKRRFRVSSYYIDMQFQLSFALYAGNKASLELGGYRLNLLEEEEQMGLVGVLVIA